MSAPEQGVPGSERGQEIRNSSRSRGSGVGTGRFGSLRSSGPFGFSPILRPRRQSAFTRKEEIGSRGHPVCALLVDRGRRGLNVVRGSRAGILSSSGVAAEEAEALAILGELLSKLSPVLPHRSASRSTPGSQLIAITRSVVTFISRWPLKESIGGELGFPRRSRFCPPFDGGGRPSAMAVRRSVRTNGGYRGHPRDSARLDS